MSSTNYKTQALNLKTVSAPQHRTPREAFPTHPLFSCSVNRPNANIPIILVDLIKTSAMKTLWEKHWLVGKRVPTHTCQHGARSFKTGAFLLQFLVTSTPFFQSLSFGRPSVSGLNRVSPVSRNSCSCRGTARGLVSRSAGLDSEVTYWNLTDPFICSSCT